jgi:hypothetical protein
MADSTYPRPAGDEGALVDALCEAGADAGIIGTGKPDMIGLSIDGATAEEIDAIWARATRELALLKLANIDQIEGHY